MNKENQTEKEIFSRDIIEFCTVAVEFCKFVEYTDHLERKDFVEKLTKILPLMYLKVSMLNPGEALYDGILEDFVTEEDYNNIYGLVSHKMGQYDSYLEVFHQDIQLSDTPIAATISENIADIYQDIKNFTLNFEIGTHEVMEEAVADVVDNFRTRWGQTLVNVLRALHNALYFESLEEDDDNKKTKSNKNNTETPSSRGYFGMNDNELNTDYSDLL